MPCLSNCLSSIVVRRCVSSWCIRTPEVGVGNVVVCQWFPNCGVHANVVGTVDLCFPRTVQLLRCNAQITECHSDKWHISFCSVTNPQTLLHSSFVASRGHCVNIRIQHFQNVVVPRARFVGRMSMLLGRLPQRLRTPCGSVCR